MTAKLTIADYPLAETRSDKIRGQRGKSLDDITLDAVMAGKVTMEDLRITPQGPCRPGRNFPRRQAPDPGPQF